jgi:hypothetical protein
MKLMKSNSNSSIIIVLTVTLLTGFISVVAYIQSVQAQVPGTGFDLKGIFGSNGISKLNLFKGPKGDTGPQGPAGPGIEFGNLTVIVHTMYSPSSVFTIHVTGNLESPGTFPGSESGTQVKLGYGSYTVTEDPPSPPNPPFSTSYSQDCTGVMSLKEMKTCTITNDPMLR